jgi:hypothetical protein
MDKEHHQLVLFSPSIAMVIKFVRIRRMGHVAHVVNKKYIGNFGWKT